MIRAAIVLFLLCVSGNKALECNSCTNVHDVSHCNSTQICSNGQACFQNRTSTIKGQEISLGCVDIKQCGVHLNAQNTLVGRDLISRQATNCLECCSSDQCSRTLCEHLSPSSCIDDESIDCARMNTLFGICADINRAKFTCPKFCGLCNVVDGKWSSWSDWSDCDVTCESGSQHRIRSCNNPVPKNGGQYCVGNSTDSIICHKSLCPVNGGWSEWAAWGGCSVSCGMGMESRTRTCSNPAPSQFGNHCFDHSLDSRLCMPVACADGGWTNWESWSKCTVTCGIGMTSRYRSCTNPRPSPYGQDCKGSNNQVQTCSNSDCVSSNYCQTSPCIHGTCSNLPNDFSCSCQKGFKGRLCNITTASTQCDLQPCFHGKCFESYDEYLCICTDGYGGKNCNISNYYCLSNPCVQGSCVSERSDYQCHCNKGYIGRNCDVTNATDCFDIIRKGISSNSGVYNITLWRSKLIKEVFCDMDTHLGGWTVFQYRFNGSVDFARNFSDYENGFGSFNGEFWLGLKIVQEIASQGKTELRLDLTAHNGTTAYEVFNNFHLGNTPDYTLHIDKGVGTAGDTGSGLSFLNAMKFYTYDHDEINKCAKNNAGGFWFRSCAYVNLNGQYGHGYDKGVIYYNFDHNNALVSTKMMMRRL